MIILKLSQGGQGRSAFVLDLGPLQSQQLFPSSLEGPFTKRSLGPGVNKLLGIFFLMVKIILI